ncbi:hypothetical protein CCR75_009610 [Bremia lactucae]|uniref:chitin synthase n=1 Tax=Bremia lactucae TaxID=4779 RepID=A0A976IE44_BRELC|nr:hypothetical protein CCR75_009610 [Bremia lactucae]
MSGAPPFSSGYQPRNMGLPPLSHGPRSSMMSIEYDGIPLPPPSIRSCGSQQYVTSYIPTGTAFHSNSVHDLISSMKSYASATDLVRTYSGIPSVEEALVTLDRAEVALKARRYRDALKLYLEGGYAMANVAERQANPKICNLLTSKGFETLNWCARLCDWIEGRGKEKHPRPGVHKVGIPVSNWDDDWVGPFMDEEEARLGLGIFFSTPATINSIVISSLIIGVFFIGSALHGELHHIFMTFTHFTALIPSFVNIFTIYSFCNLQDLSWGTKGLHDDPLLAASFDETEKGDFNDVIAKRRAIEERRREEKERTENRKKIFEAFRTNVLLTWSFSNLIYALFIVYFSKSSTYMPLLYTFVAGINACRLLGCIGHWIYIHTAGMRNSVLDKSECGNGTGRYPQTSYVQLEEHYAALAEDQRAYASGRINGSNHDIMSSV